MLIRFKVSNFRAFRDLQELSMIASALKENNGSVAQVEGFSLGMLRVAAIYGANASGKTTILRALQFFVDVVRDSQRTWKPDGPIPVEPFVLDEKNLTKPSSFELDFLLEGVRYEYGFDLTTREVVKEWLYSFPNGRRQVWYERQGGPQQQIRFGKKFSGENRAIQALTRPNSLYLSAGAQNNHELLLPVFRWLTNTFSFEFGRRSEFTMPLAGKCESSEMQNRLSKLLTAADLGIVGLDVKKEKVEVRQELRDAMSTFMQALAKIDGMPSLESIPDIPEEMPQLLLRHKSAVPAGVTLPNANESAGTAAFLSLLLATFETIDSGGVLCVDELDSSLHPLLALEIVRLFADRQRNPRSAQLLFNTHDVNLLDSSVLRRDEIWFVEKDQDGSAHLYSLSDFKPRRNENLKRGYLQGRYGAVPFVGPFDLELHST